MSICLRHSGLVGRTSAYHFIRRAFSSNDETVEPWIPPYVEKADEPINDKRSRLQYQSRKRGMLENGLLLGSFASKHLGGMTPDQLSLYDRLINLPSNDWEIYYWATGARPTPDEFDNEVMKMLKDHARNEKREQRLSLPDLQ